MTESQDLTILFADISGSTRLFEQRGDVTARQLIASVLAALIDICNGQGGRVVKTIGDEIMCTFPDARAGVTAACRMHRRLAADPGFHKENLAIRIGLHHGTALIEPNDVFGDVVNTAARMVALAKREQIVGTASTLAALASSGEWRLRSLGRTRVPGKLLPMDIAEVIWQEDTADLTAVHRTQAASADEEAAAVVTLCYRGRVIELDDKSEPFTLGREAGNGITVEQEWVSRIHATIEFKRRHFVVTDRSTNGTYIKLGQDDEIWLHRDELHLRKSGSISLGRGFARNQDDIVYFQCNY